MRGVELPINILVLVVIAVVVLLGIIAVYFVGWNPFPGTVGLESVKNMACAELVRSGCTKALEDIPTPNFDANKDGSIDDDDTLVDLCENYYNIDPDDESKCKALCGCVTIA